MGCANNTQPYFPDIYQVYELDAVRGYLVPYKVISKDPFRLSQALDPVKFSHCDGCVVMKYSDFIGILEYKKAAEEYANSHNKCFKK